MTDSKLKRLNGLEAARAESGNDHGFTLIELMIAMVIALIVVGGIAGLFSMLSRDYTTQNVSAEVQQKARNGIDFAVKDIRLAGLNPKKTANDAGFVAISDTSIEFKADRDGNGQIDARGDYMRYFWNGSQLIRELIGLNGNPTTDMSFADNVTGLTFTYLDQDDVTLDVLTADPLDVRTVEIAMTVRQPAGRRGQVERSYSMRVRCRNMGL